MHTHLLEECVIGVVTIIVALGVIAFVVCFCAAAGHECWQRVSRYWDQVLLHRAAQEQEREEISQMLAQAEGHANRED